MSERASVLDRVLVVLDDHQQARAIEGVLTESGYRVTHLSIAEATRRRIRGGPYDLAIVDRHGLSASTCDLIWWLTCHDPYNVILVLGGPGETRQNLRGMKYGGEYGIPGDIDASSLRQVVADALRARERRWGVAPRPADAFDTMTARSAAMRELLGRARTVAEGTANILVGGPRGAGKELLARAIHRASRRHTEPLMMVNCAAIPENLLESELFGHRRSRCFAGPPFHQDRPGLAQQADRGTLALDEAGDLSLPIQAKLLGVLETGEARAVGSDQSTPVDLRYLLTTSRDLSAEIAAGRFSRELYERLQLSELVIPPLVERADDILPLAEHFRAEFARSVERPVEGFSAAARQLLVAYDWPGNVRELRNAVELAVVVGKASQVMPEDLPARVRGG